MTPTPGLEDILAAAGAEGWDAIERLTNPRGQQAGEVAEQARRVAQAAARLFATDDGKIVLEWLLDMTFRRPVWSAALGLSPDQAFGLGAHREGQNSIVFLLAKAIAEGGAPPASTTPAEMMPNARSSSERGAAAGRRRSRSLKRPRKPAGDGARAAGPSDPAGNTAPRVEPGGRLSESDPAGEPVAGERPRSPRARRPGRPLSA